MLVLARERERDRSSYINAYIHMDQTLHENKGCRIPLSKQNNTQYTEENDENRGFNADSDDRRILTVPFRTGGCPYSSLKI